MKMGTDECHFNVSFTVQAQRHNQCPCMNHNFRRETEAHARLEQPSVCLSAYKALPPGQTGSQVPPSAGPFCFTSTEARWLIRDGDRGGRGRKSESSTADTARKRPERPWTATITIEVLRRCPPRHCPATSALRNCCFNCRAWAESQGQCPLHCKWAFKYPEQPSTAVYPRHVPYYKTETILQTQSCF